MSDALIAELIAAIKAAIADGKGELHPHHLRRRLGSAHRSGRGDDDNFGDECHRMLRDRLRAIGERTRG